MTQVAPTDNRQTLPEIAGPRLQYHPAIKERFGIDRASWKALVEAIFPTATSVESVVLALSYCRARKLDPFKRCVHIVPIWNKDLGRMVDTIWPGIGELRTTAFRTGQYAGRGETQWGPDVKTKIGTRNMVFPEWAQVTVYRFLPGQGRVPFAGPTVYWVETYATRARNDATPNEMWGTRPRGQIEKCAEAAALRAAFPEEIGQDYVPEEVGHNDVIDIPGVQQRPGQDRLAALADKLEADAAAEMATTEDEQQQPEPELEQPTSTGNSCPDMEAIDEEAPPHPDGPPTMAQIGTLSELEESLQLTAQSKAAYLRKYTGVKKFFELNYGQAEDLIQRLKDRPAQQAMEQQAGERGELFEHQPAEAGPYREGL